MRQVIGIVVCLLVCGIASATAADTVKLALIDPLSGPCAYQGNNAVHIFQMGIDEINARGGVLGGRKIQFAAFDNKGSPQETLIVLKQV